MAFGMLAISALALAWGSVEGIVSMAKNGDKASAEDVRGIEFSTAIGPFGCAMYQGLTGFWF
jgi:hypothetical protein